MSFIDARHAPRRNIGRIKIYQPECFEAMRKAGQVAAACLDMLADEVEPGVSTGHIDDLARQFMFDHGADPATIYYRGYRHSCCISINHVVCHGIPDHKRLLKDGDIVNIDVTAVVDGWHGDTSRMYAVGKPKPGALRLIELTWECLDRAIGVVKPGARLGDIGAAIQTCAKAGRGSVVEVFCGHGLGKVFHDEPNILHFGKQGEGTALRPGMFFTIEPMINLGRKDVKFLPDKWTAVTRDKKLSAQFEHSIGVTESGCEIFTSSPLGLERPWRGKARQ